MTSTTAISRSYSFPIALILFFVVAQSVLSRPAVFSDLTLDQAKAKAQTEKKILLLDFMAEWCPPCKMMDETTWQDPEVVSFLNQNAVALQIDVDRDRKTAESFDIQAMPTMIIFQPSDLLKESKRTQGYKNSERLLSLLKDENESGSPQSNFFMIGFLLSALFLIGAIARDRMKPEGAAIRKFYQAVKEKNFKEALSHCEEGLSKNPNSIELLVNAAAVGIPLKEFEKTLQFCNRGLELEPRNANLLCNRSAANNNLSRHNEAIEDATRAIAIDPKHQASYLNRAFSYLVQRKFPEAVADCKKAESMKLTDVDIIHAEALNSMNRFDEALSVCQKAFERVETQASDVDLSGLYVTRGNIYHGMRKPELAIKDFDEAIKLNPRCEPAYVNRSGSYLINGDVLKAQEELDNLARMKLPENLKAYPQYTQIRVFIKNKQWEKAWKAASMALEKYPDSPIMNSMVAYLHLHDKNYDEALKHINKSIEIDTFSREAHWIRHEIYEATGQAEDAAADKKIAVDFGYVPYLA